MIMIMIMIIIPHPLPHHGNIEPVLGQLHGVSCIIQSMVRIHGLVLRAQARCHGIHKSSNVSSVFPV